jgi:ligand-binding sensor domain-containing protein/signal transduction histidine kinase
MTARMTGSRRVLALRLLATMLLTAPPALAARLPMRIYDSRNGLPQDHVLALARDRDGRPWACTSEGLAWFDGHAFVAMPGLPSPAATVMLARRDGHHLVGTLAGLFAFDPSAVPPSADDGRSPPWRELGSLARQPLRAFTEIPVDDGEPHQVMELAETTSGTWCGTADGLYHLVEDGRDSHLVRVPLEGLPQDQLTGVASIVDDGHGGLLVGTDWGLLQRRADGSWRRIEVDGDLVQQDVNVVSRDARGRFWVGLTLGVYVLELADSPDGMPRVSVPDVARSLPSQRVNAILHATDGTIWIGTAGGLVTLDAKTGAVHVQSRREGLPSDAVTCLMEDLAGDAWAGTETGGVVRVAGTQLAVFDEHDGLADVRIASLGRDVLGRIVVGSAGIVNVLEGERFMPVMAGAGDVAPPSWGWNQIAFQDRERDWWWPSVGGLYRFENVARAEDLVGRHPSSVLRMRDGLGGDNVFRVFEDVRGDIVMGTFTAERAPLSRWERATGRVLPIPAPAGLAPQAPTIFRNDRSGALWVGFYHGTVARLRDGHWEVIAPADPKLRGTVRDMLLDSQGRMWIAWSRQGLACVDDPTAALPVIAHRFGPEEGLSSHDASALAEDEDGAIWIGTSRGLDRLDPVTGHIEHASVSDSLPGAYVNVLLRDGRALWIGTLDGLARWIPRREPRRRPPATWITGLRVAGVALALPATGSRRVDGLVLEPGSAHVDVDFGGLAPAPGDPLLFRHCLDDGREDGPWTGALDARSVSLVGLGAGPHRFRVVAVSPDGGESLEPAVVEFEVLAPTWRRPWFLALAAMALAGGVGALHGARTRRLVELERVRTRIATDLHDDVGASLSQLAILCEIARRQAQGAQVTGLLDRIAGTARDLVDSMSDIAWGIDPRRDSVHDLVSRMRRFGLDVLEEAGIAFDLDARIEERDAAIGADVRRQVFLTFKEAVRNAARHSGCARVAVSLRREGQTLMLEVSDDGRGMSGAEEPGLGLASLRARAASLGGRLDVTSRPEEGTRLVLAVPLRRAARIA